MVLITESCIFFLNGGEMYNIPNGMEKSVNKLTMIVR